MLNAVEASPRGAAVEIALGAARGEALLEVRDRGGGLSEEERRRNVRGAFALNPDRSVAGLKVLLVDDVYTSGATANECSRTLLGNGAERVYVLTLARAVS